MCYKENGCHSPGDTVLRADQIEKAQMPRKDGILDLSVILPLWASQVKEDCPEIIEDPYKYESGCQHKKNKSGKCHYWSCPRKGEVKAP